MISVAVVILNYNGRKLLEQFLPTVIQRSEGATIVVADNHSTDDSIPFLREHFPQVSLIESPANLGFCGGYNYALPKVKADIFVLLNSDVEVAEGWLTPVLRAFETDEQLAAAQPKILSFSHRQQFEYAGAGGGFIDTLGYPFCRGRIFDSVEPDNGQFDDTRLVFWATGACLFIRSSHFHQLGGFDESFFAHMEEIDLCWRLHRSGHGVAYIGSSRVYHVGGGTLSSQNPRKTYLNFRNGLALLIYHLPASQLWWKLPLRLAFDWLAAFTFLLRNHRDSLAVLKAHYHFFNRMKRALSKRRHLRKTLGAPRTEHGLIYPRLLIVDYFIKKRRRFAELRWN